MEKAGTHRLLGTLRWILLVPATLILATIAYSVSVRVYSAIASLTGAPLDSGVARWVLGGLIYGLAGFCLVVIPAIIAPAHKPRVAVAAAGVVLVVAIGIAVTGLLNRDRWAAINAAIATAAAAAAATAVWRGGGDVFGGAGWLYRLERYLD